MCSGRLLWTLAVDACYVWWALAMCGGSLLCVVALAMCSGRLLCVVGACCGRLLCVVDNCYV